MSAEALAKADRQPPRSKPSRSSMRASATRSASAASAPTALTSSKYLRERAAGQFAARRDRQRRRDPDVDAAAIWLPPADIAHAMKRNPDGSPASPLGMAAAFLIEAAADV
jgi:hypothetical protein